MSFMLTEKGHVIDWIHSENNAGKIYVWYNICKQNVHLNVNFRLEFGAGSDSSLVVKVKAVL